MLIDAHVHLDKYGDLLDEAIAEIERDSIFTVATAMDGPSYLALQKIARRSSLVLPTFGIHPKRAPDYAHRLNEIGRFIDTSPAIGEIGLDFHWVQDSSQYPVQRRVLEYCFAAAREQKKIVNLHTKGAEREILELLERYHIDRAIIHWYSGPLDILRALAQFGTYFTVGVEVLYSEKIRAIACEIPDHLLLTETDNPGGLKWLQGVVGMPRAIKDVVQAISTLKAMSREVVERTVQQNLMRMIDGDPWLKDVRALLAQEEPPS